MSFRAAPVTELSEAQMHALVLYRDAGVLIINKPAGIAVHKGAHGGADIESFFHHLQFGLPRVPSLAHRLDRETSGCLVLGRHPQAIRRLGHLFSSNQAEKTYLALVVGAPQQEYFTLDTPIRKTGHGARWRIELHPDGQQAITHVRVLQSGEVSLLELTPKTGRTHQLRVHLAGAGLPILGDPFYGVKEGKFSAAEASTMLHAWKIALPYDAKKTAITATAPLPNHLRVCLQLFPVMLNVVKHLDAEWLDSSLRSE